MGGEAERDSWGKHCLVLARRQSKGMGSNPDFDPSSKVIAVKSAGFSGPQFPHLRNGANCPSPESLTGWKIP